MTRSTDIAVVGGGIMGAAIALRLAEVGTGRVCLLEKSHLGAGSSGKSGAILRQHYSHVETVRMAREGLLFFGEFAARYGIDIGFRRTGMMFIVDPRDRAALEAHIQMQRGLGVPTQMVDEAAMAECENRGSYEEDAVGCWEEDAGTVDPRAAVSGLARAAVERGVTLVEGERVTQLLRDENRVRGVSTSHGTLHADHVVLAAGPWTEQLLSESGWRAPLQIVRPEQAFLEPPVAFGPATPTFADLRLGVYWKAEGPRHTRVGAVSFAQDGIVDDPDHYDEGVSDAFVKSCRDAVAQRLPAYAIATPWGGCGALYTVTPDAHPLIGPVPGLDGCTVVSGFSGHGFKLAPAVGRGISEWILNGEPEAFPASFFSPLRFDEGRSIGSGYEYAILG